MKNHTDIAAMFAAPGLIVALLLAATFGVSASAQGYSPDGPIFCYASNCRLGNNTHGRDMVLGWNDNGNNYTDGGETPDPVPADLSPYSTFVLSHENTNGAYFDSILTDPAQSGAIRDFLHAGARCRSPATPTISIKSERITALITWLSSLATASGSQRMRRSASVAVKWNQ